MKIGKFCVISCLLALAGLSMSCATAESIASDVADDAANEAADESTDRAKEGIRSADESSDDDESERAGASDSDPGEYGNGTTDSRGAVTPEDTDPGPYGDEDSNKQGKYPRFREETEWSKQRAASYSGEICYEAYDSLEDIANRRSGDDEEDVESTLRRKVLLMSCKDHIVEYKNGTTVSDVVQSKKIGPFDLEKMHLNFDDRNFNHVKAAVMAVYADLGYPAPPSLRGEDDVASRAMRGICYGYGTRVKTDKLKKGLRDRGLPNDAIDVFVTLFDSAMKSFDSDMKEMSEGERIVTYEIPANVVQKRATNYKQYSEIYARLDELTKQTNEALSGSKDAYKVSKKLAKLRGDYLDQCDEADCLMTPDYQRITKQLRMLYLGQKDLAGLYAERAAYNDPTREEEYDEIFNLIPISNHIYYQRRMKMFPMTHAYREYQQAREDGATKQAALAMVGGGPILEDIIRIEDMHTDEITMKELGKNIRGRVENKRATVQRIERSGNTARLIFVQETHRSHTPYDCVETDKVERITPDGRVIYRTRCKWRESTYESPEADPITVPAYEAKSIKGGDDVRFVVGGNGEGHIVRVFRSSGVVQMRDYVK